MLNEQQIAKDALSKVSRNFFKEFKMNYHRYRDHLRSSLETLIKFFSASFNDTVRSFFLFNVIILCETIAKEQLNLALLVTKDRVFVTQQGIDKFTDELLFANEISKVLFHNQFPSFNAVRVQRDILFKLKKFTELAYRRITRYCERSIERGTPVVIKFKNDV